MKIRRAASVLASFVRRDTVLIVLLLLVAGSGWAFAEIADEVREGDAHVVDDAVIDWLHRGDDPSRPIGLAWLAVTALDLTALGSASVLTLVVSLVAGYLAMRRAYRSVGLLLVATILGTMLSTVLKDVFGRERPPEELHLAEVASASFPSGHSLLSTIVYLTLAAVVASTRTRRNERVYIIVAAAGIAAVVGVTRVYLGVHYPTDVLAGWSLGLAWTLFCVVVARWLRRRHVVEETTD